MGQAHVSPIPRDSRKTIRTINAFHSFSNVSPQKNYKEIRRI